MAEILVSTRIAILEKMAEEIYREWFVRMRFPGHETVTFHKGVPQGWEVGILKFWQTFYRPDNHWVAIDRNQRFRLIIPLVGESLTVSGHR